MATDDRTGALGRDPASLREQLRQVSTQSKQLHRLRQNDTGNRKYHSVFGYTQFASRSVVAVYMLSEYDEALAAKKLLSFCRVGSPVPCNQEAECLVKDMVVAMPDAFIESRFDPHGSVAERLVSSAKRYIAEAKTVEWVAVQNMQHGVAPSSLGARAEFDRMHLLDDSPTAAKTARQWARRWKRRWCVSRGRLRREEPMTKGTVTGKVSWTAISNEKLVHHLRSFFASNAAHFSCPFSGQWFYYRTKPRPC
jgi:hypothetical protein